MRDRPPGVSDADIRAALAEGWGIHARSVRYLPVGAGSYHWLADDRWFVTVDGLRFATTFDPLRRALETARALHRSLDFVVAPIDGPHVLWPLSSGHAMSVYPLVEGEAGDFGPHGTTRESVIALMARLHEATVPVADTEWTDLRLLGRDGLVAALGSVGGAWGGGPYAERARGLLAAHEGKIRGWLDDHERMGGELRRDDLGWVITHGEPHPGNVLRARDGLLLIDWDTVRVAPPERDLWLLTRDPFAVGGKAADLVRYTEITGRRVSEAGLAFYRLNWILADIVSYTDVLRRPHGAGGDAEAALTYLTANVATP